jgi:hypothetical protein
MIEVDWLRWVTWAPERMKLRRQAWWGESEAENKQVHPNDQCEIISQKTHRFVVPIDSIIQKSGYRSETPEKGSQGPASRCDHNQPTNRETPIHFSIQNPMYENCSEGANFEGRIHGRIKPALQIQMSRGLLNVLVVLGLLVVISAQQVTIW